MLIAEIHGHVVKEAAGSEDYLTSAIFGHLRYLPPSVFWEEFLAHAVGLPADGAERTLAAFVADAGHRIREYLSLAAFFWPSHPLHGTPDMVLCFAGPGLRTFVLAIEVKLWSGKSGEGDQDQLCRYMRILDDLGALVPGLGRKALADAVTALLYLTPRESRRELIETSQVYGNSGCERLFRAQWQDVAAAARKSMADADGIRKEILRDVAAFLRARGLEYFNGFTRVGLDSLPESCGCFYDACGGFPGFQLVPFDAVNEGAGAFYAGSGAFGGFAFHDGAEPFAIVQGRWVR